MCTGPCHFAEPRLGMGSVRPIGGPSTRGPRRTAEDDPERRTSGRPVSVRACLAYGHGTPIVSPLWLIYAF